MWFQARLWDSELSFGYDGKTWKIRDKKVIFAAVLKDLSKAFDCIPHNLLIAKLSAYGFDRKSMILISAYLKSRKQKTRIGAAFSDYII